jgi:SAM-dependent methyltransferase
MLGIPPRRHDPELMDGPGLPEAEIAHAYRGLRRVNWMLGNLRTLDLELARFLAEERPGPGRLIVLDVGSGSGDVPARLAARLGRLRPGSPVTAVAIDLDPTALALARRGEPGLGLVRADALRLPLADASVDLATAVKFAHHFEGENLARLLAELARVARRRVVVLDIRRHWAAYWGFVAWSRVFTTSRLVRHDGPLSVLRGFTADELADLGRSVSGYRWSVRRYAGFQLALVGSRSTDRP